MCLGNKEAHDGGVDAGVLWITGLMAEHKAGLAEGHLVGDEKALSLRIARRGSDSSTPEKNIHECA